MSKNKENGDNLKEALVLGIAGVVGGYASVLNFFPLGRSQNPIESGHAVFEKTRCVLELALRKK